MEKSDKPLSLNDVFDAIEELTKAVTELAKDIKTIKEEWAKWRKAGKF